MTLLQGNPKVSVIVPMYNVEKYVAQCLESILSQTLFDIEVIAVDDGSPDSSGEIAESYARRDRRVRVIHQENAGLGPARNSGMDIARGEYVGFVDSDDWVHPDMFEGLYNAASQAHADIAAGGCETWTDGRLVTSEPHPLAGATLVGADEIEPVRQFFYGRLPGDRDSRPHPVSVCFAIFKNIAKHTGPASVRFCEILSEDVIFDIDAYRKASVVTYTDGCGYCYRKDSQESITRTFSHEKLYRNTAFFAKLAEMAEAEDDSEACLLRARRKMVDYSRSYVFMIEKSGLSLGQKAEEVRALLATDEFRTYCADYPVDRLPKFQALFHGLLVRGNVRSALALTRLRMISRGER